MFVGVILLVVKLLECQFSYNLFPDKHFSFYRNNIFDETFDETAALTFTNTLTLHYFETIFH